MKGAGVEGTRYFVQDGKLDGEAPSLASVRVAGWGHPWRVAGFVRTAPRFPA